MKPSQWLRPLLYNRHGSPRAVLIARMHLAKYAATRGWVIPFLTERSSVSESWKNAKRDDGIGYKAYIELDPLSVEILAEVGLRAGFEQPILDLGCNVGRELNALWRRGHRNLSGIEIGVEPVRAMRKLFPEMAAGSRILNCSMTEGLKKLGDSEFDLVYAHGSLVSISASEQFVFNEIVRVCGRWLITLENEWSLMLFPRDFGKVFQDRGLSQLSERVVGKESNGRKRAVLRVFEKKSGVRNGMP